MSHTPTPWRVRDGSDRGMGIWVDAPGLMVENNRGPSYTRQILEDDDYPEKLADAEFIVRAVNCHDDLVGAHEENVRILGFLVNELQGRIEGGKLAALAGCLERSSAALAKAQP